MEQTRKKRSLLRRWRRVTWGLSAFLILCSTALAAYIGVVLLNVIVILSLTLPPPSAAPLAEGTFPSSPAVHADVRTG